MYGDFAPAAAVAVVCLAIVAAKAVNAWRRVQTAKVEADLKLEMVARGMTAEQIEKVLAVRSSGDSDDE